MIKMRSEAPMVTSINVDVFCDVVLDNILS
jgi:hypothetical protein